MPAARILALEPLCSAATAVIAGQNAVVFVVEYYRAGRGLSPVADTAVAGCDVAVATADTVVAIIDYGALF